MESGSSTNNNSTSDGRARRYMTMWNESIAWMCMFKDIRHKGLHVEKFIVELRCAR